jgi:hypothetical protein
MRYANKIDFSYGMRYANKLHSPGLGWLMFRDRNFAKNRYCILPYVCGIFVYLL